MNREVYTLKVFSTRMEYDSFQLELTPKENDEANDYFGMNCNVTVWCRGEMCAKLWGKLYDENLVYASGMDILSFGVAVDDRRRNQSTGEYEDYTNFVDCVLFGNRAEFFHRHLHKGKKVYVEGKLRYSSWEKDGQKRSKLEVIVDEVEFFSQRGGSDQQGGGRQSYSGSASATVPAQQSSRPPVQAPPQAETYDEDIPF